MRRHPTSEPMRFITRELITYTAASAASLGVDMGVLTLLVSGFGWPYLPAAITSFVTGGLFLYFASTVFVFRFRRITNRAIELPVFLALGLIGLVVNTIVIYAAVEALHVHYLLAKGLAAGCTFALNYLLRRNLMFSRVPVALSRIPAPEPTDG
jgi:putative flippase GtrA